MYEKKETILYSAASASSRPSVGLAVVWREREKLSKKKKNIFSSAPINTSLKISLRTWTRISSCSMWNVCWFEVFQFALIYCVVKYHYDQPLFCAVFLTVDVAGTDLCSNNNDIRGYCVIFPILQSFRLNSAIEISTGESLAQLDHLKLICQHTLKVKVRWKNC